MMMKQKKCGVDVYKEGLAEQLFFRSAHYTVTFLKK